MEVITIQWYRHVMWHLHSWGPTDPTHTINILLNHFMGTLFATLCNMENYCVHFKSFKIWGFLPFKTETMSQRQSQLSRNYNNDGVRVIPLTLWWGVCMVFGLLSFWFTAVDGRLKEVTESKMLNIGKCRIHWLTWMEKWSTYHCWHCLLSGFEHCSPSRTSLSARKKKHRFIALEEGQQVKHD